MRRFFCICLYATLLIPAMAMAKSPDLVITRNTPSGKFSVGLTLNQLTPLLCQKLRITPTEGLYVKTVAEGSAAKEAGLLRGDIVQAIDGRPVRSPADLDLSLNKAADEAVFNVKRRDGYQNFTVRLTPQDQATTKLLSDQSATVVIHHVTIEPTVVPPGASFDLKIGYSVLDATLGASDALMTLKYEILDKGKVVFVKRIKMKVPHNQRNTATKPGLVAANKKGQYELRVTLDYRGKFAGQSVPLIVQ